MQLTFLPVYLVASSFEQIQELIPSILDLDDFLAYFETTWIQGVTTARTSKPARYPPPSWNLVDRTTCSLNKTNNYMEKWNRKFSAIVGHAHPTIWNFLQSVYLEHTNTEEAMIKERHGDVPPAKRPR